MLIRKLFVFDHDKDAGQYFIRPERTDEWYASSLNRYKNGGDYFTYMLLVFSPQTAQKQKRYDAYCTICVRQPELQSCEKTLSSERRSRGLFSSQNILGPYKQPD